MLDISVQIRYLIYMINNNTTTQEAGMRTGQIISKDQGLKIGRAIMSDPRITTEIKKIITRDILVSEDNGNGFWLASCVAGHTWYEDIILAS